MMQPDERNIEKEYAEFISSREFPCVAARAAIDRQQVKCLVVDHMACPKDDMQILQFLYDFIDDYRVSSDLFHNATIIFKQPVLLTEDLYEDLLWQRLQALSNLDALQYDHDSRVDPDPSSPQFSFSLKREAFFIIGLHPASSRPGRRFTYPALAFNPHSQFEQLRETNRYNKMTKIVRKRDFAYAGSINPMLEEFGKSSEVFQYSGRFYNDNWQCPLKNNYELIEDHSST